MKTSLVEVDLEGAVQEAISSGMTREEFMHLAGKSWDREIATARHITRLFGSSKVMEG